jgi:SAM-dependent methyltransferase
VIPQTRLQYVRLKLAKNLNRRGVWGTLRVCLLKASDAVRDMLPRYRRLRAIEREFDQANGVRTDFTVELEDLDVAGRQGSGYQPTPATVLEPILNGIGIDFRQFTFVDLGSGMGRVLLIASRFPFKKIVGVEFSADLQLIAEQNIRACRRDGRQSEIELRCMDAGEYQPPEGNVLIYMFNPFPAPVMEKVIANIKRSLEDSPREIIVFYYNCLDRHLFDPLPFLENIASATARPGIHPYAIYRARANGGELRRAS